MLSIENDEKYYVNIENFKYQGMCCSVKTMSYLKNTERTQKYSLYHFSTKLTRAELVKTRARALFTGMIWAMML